MIDTVLSIVSGLVGVVLGSSLMFYRQNKAAKIIENESALSHEWAILYAEKKNENAELQLEIQTIRAQVYALEKQISELEIKLLKYESEQ